MRALKGNYVRPVVYLGMYMDYTLACKSLINFIQINFKNLRVFHNILISKRNTVYITRVYIHEVVMEIKCVMLGCNTVERGLDFIRPIRPR